MRAQLDWDYFVTDFGANPALRCKVCNQVLVADDRARAKTAWHQSVGCVVHDYFTCPNAGQAWHDQARSILRLAEDTPSKVLADMLRCEASALVADRVATKVIYGALLDEQEVQRIIARNTNANTCSSAVSDTA
jgi:hypothetical protein